MTRYPLSWPMGWKRTPSHQRQSAKFGKGEFYSFSTGGGYNRKRELTIYEATQRVLEELERFGVRSGTAIISTNLELRQDGLPRSNQRVPADPGVAVYWKRRDDKTEKCMAIDRYDRVADNLAAIAATLCAMRAIERHGGAQILDRAFQGFDALPAPGATVKPWRDVFGFAHGDEITGAVVTERYRAMRSKHHPDKGGDGALFHAVQVAYEQACREFPA